MDEIVDGQTDTALGRRIAGALGVGGINQQRQHALAPQRGKAVEIDDLVSDGRVVYLEVAGVDDGADRAADGIADGVWDRVVDMDWLNGEIAEADGLPRLDDDHIGVDDGAFLELGLDESERQLGAVDGHLQLTQQIGQPSDMILVSVSDKDAAHARTVADKIAEIGNDDIDAEQLVVREFQPAVNNNNVLLIFVGRNVLADLLDAPQRDDAQRGGAALAVLAALARLACVSRFAFFAAISGVRDERRLGCRLLGSGRLLFRRRPNSRLFGGSPGCRFGFPSGGCFSRQLACLFCGRVN